MSDDIKDFEEVKPEIEAKPNSLDPILTKEQQEKVVELWNSRKDNPPSVKELVIAAFGQLSEQELDGRSRYSRAIKVFLTERQTKLEKAVKSINKDKLVLTEEQKEYIANNCKTMKMVEMANVLFGKECQFASSEVRLVSDYIRNELGQKVTNSGTNEDEYSPPKTLISAARRVNKYILDAIEEKEIDQNPKLQNCLKSLIRFCHMYRFTMLINNYKNKKHKELFEQAYVRFVWDKPDLSEIELDLVCNICCDIVSYTSMQSELEDLLSMKAAVAEDSEGRKLSMSLVEDIKNLRKEMDENHKRQSTAWKNLEGTRNDRIKNRVLENASMVQLLDAWRNEEKRKQLIQLGEVRKQKMKEEIHRIQNLDDLHIQVWGIEEGVIHA